MKQDLVIIPAAETPDIDTMKRADTLAIFEDFRTKALALKATAETLTVTSVDQVAEMKLARQTRLSFKALRIEVEKKRKELGEEALRQKQKIDGDARTINSIIEPLEERLLEQEQFAEREALHIENEKRDSRIAEITPFCTAPLAMDLGKMPDADYANLLRDMKDAHAARLERERKEKEEAEARTKAEAEERDRIRLENERLKKEAVEREAAAKKQREELEAKAKAEREKAAQEAKAAADKARKDREAIESDAKRQREEVEAKARAEREAAEAKAAKERAEAKAKADAALAKEKKEREAAEESTLKEKEKRERIEQEIREADALEAKRKLEEEASKEKAALAPEKEQLRQLANRVRGIILPALKTKKGLALNQEITGQREKFAKWIEKRGSEL